MATLAPDIPEITITVPDDIAERIEVVELDGGIEVAVKQEVSGLNSKSDTGTTTAVVGKKVADSSFTAKAKKGDESTIGFTTTKVNKSEITVKGKGAGTVNFNTGRINNSSIEFKRNSEDSVNFNSGVQLRNVTVNAGKGDDTITFKANTKILGSNEITLGAGADVLEVPAEINGKGKIVVTDLAKNDTIKVGDESFSGRDILKGEVELPKFIEIEGLD